MIIGIYGGSFNPIHRGHTQLASAIIGQNLVDELWLLVSPLNPLKESESESIAAYAHRLRMAQLATENMPRVRVSDFESHLPVPSYMVNTLAKLSEAYPQHTFKLVIGADNWRNFSRWYHYEEILKSYGILMYRRPGYEIEEESQLPSSVSVVETDLYDISSTQIRQALQRGDRMGKWLDEKVVEYIIEHHLYAFASLKPE